MQLSNRNLSKKDENGAKLLHLTQSAKMPNAPEKTKKLIWSALEYDLVKAIGDEAFDVSEVKRIEKGALFVVEHQIVLLSKEDYDKLIQ